MSIDSSDGAIPIVIETSVVFMIFIIFHNKTYSITLHDVCKQIFLYANIYDANVHEISFPIAIKQLYEYTLYSHCCL